MREIATSVIVPAFNAAGTLGRALRSVLGQAPPPLEIIVVDDGSTDGTELVARAFGSRIRFLQQPNAGPAAARNRGLQAARGEYVAFLDADDYWLPGFLAAGQDFLAAHPEAVAMSVGLQRLRLSGSAVLVLPRLAAERGAKGRGAFLIENFFAFWGEHDHVRTGACLIRRRTVKAAGLQLENLRVSEDLEYVGYLATFGKWGFEPKVLWVSDSERATAQSGWRRKERLRQKCCPTIEQWQARIVPRLKGEEWPGFLRVRGRVASFLAQILVQGRQHQVAKQIVQAYGPEMPPVWSTRLMRVGARFGHLSWLLACGILALRQYQKGLYRSMEAACARRRPGTEQRTSRARIPFQIDQPMKNVPMTTNANSSLTTPVPKSNEDSSGVSVIVPVFNGAHCLGRAVRSALQQRPAPREVILVNDGSTDQTAAAAKSFGSEIIYLEQQNLGPGAARNAGLKIATGEFIAFLDADDYWLPGFLSACVSFLRSQPQAIAVSTGLRFQHNEQADQVHPASLLQFDPAQAEPWLVRDFFSFWGIHDHLRTGSATIRKCAIDRAGYQQSQLRVAQDLEYWAYLGTFGAWGFIPEVYWVGDSENMALVPGWMSRYRQRRRLCPTVEQWQARILPRLRPEDWSGFKKVRGRVAASFAQSHVLSAHFHTARKIVREYGPEMPCAWSTQALRAGNRYGGLAWWAVCLLLWLRENEKAWLMKARAWRRVLPEPARTACRPQTMPA